VALHMAARQMKREPNGVRWIPGTRIALRGIVCFEGLSLSLRHLADARARVSVFIPHLHESPDICGGVRRRSAALIDWVTAVGLLVAARVPVAAPGAGRSGT
jgi:hypothetical protein